MANIVKSDKALDVVESHVHQCPGGTLHIEEREGAKEKKRKIK